MSANVAAWWASLSDEDRRALRPCKRPKILVRFVERGAEEDDGGVDFYEYLVNHEVYLVDPPPFHICTAEPAAREALRRGRIPATFRCPRRSDACPMRAIVDAAPDRDARFTLEGGER